MKPVIITAVMLVLLSLSACTDTPETIDITEPTEPTEITTERATEAPKSAGTDYTITYALKNAEGKYADLAIGPLIAAYNVLDFGADPTGETDNTKIFQNLIDRIGRLGGGTLYIPEGFYRVNSTLTIKKGVTIRGDWVKPDKNSPAEGTVLLAYAGRDKTHTAAPLIETEIGAGVMNLAIFYPEQDPNDIIKYSPAITLGVDGYFGNEYNNVKNVTLINAYIGVMVSRTNGGGAPVVNGLYGSPLFSGVDIDNIAEVGRVENLDFSPDYWINCGLYEKLGINDPFANAGAAQSVKDYIYDNATGLIMRRNDWSYAAYLRVDGYKTGFMAAHSNSSMTGAPNGHNYDFYFTNCRYGVYIEAGNSVGIMFNKTVAENCETGVAIGESVTGAAQFANSKIDAATAIYTHHSSGSRLLIHESEIYGQVSINGGTFQATDAAFNRKGEDEPHIYIGAAGRANIVGCRFDGEPDIQNDSFFASNIDHAPLESKKAPEFPELRPIVKMPAKFNLYVAERVNGDNTGTIQQAMDRAAADGGGYVYLPAGKWRLDSYITVPGGVELVGSMNNSSVPHGEGTILECSYGKNDAAAPPFIQLAANAGIRGFTIDYPMQIYEQSDNYEPDVYPYAIQGQGENIYAVNIGLRAAYAGLDLFTYRCDNFYVDFLTGHVFKSAVRVGANSENGILSNLMFNTIVYACGQESKFGSFDNSPRAGVSNAPVYDYAYANTDFITLGDSKNITLYNNFMFGVHRGVYFTDDGSGGPESGISMGTGVDAATYALCFGEGVKTQNFDFINTQIVTLLHGFSPRDAAYIYSAGDNDFDVNLFSADFWGNPAYSVYMGENSGKLRLFNAQFDNAGQALANIKGGTFTLVNGSVGRAENVAAGNSGEFTSITASTIPQAKGGFAEWRGNISNTMDFAADGIIAKTALDRSEWRANASHNRSAARRAFDNKIETRWDTSASQVPGQWFTLDLGGEYRFNYLILDVGSSTGDAPAQWSVYVSADGENWGEAVAEGSKGNGIIAFAAQTASHIKIEQNGNDGLYWSIHEMYVCLIE